jgi:tetratricopeptide (TPR) repeat protein
VGVLACIASYALLISARVHPAIAQTAPSRSVPTVEQVLEWCEPIPSRAELRRRFESSPAGMIDLTEWSDALESQVSAALDSSAPDRALEIVRSALDSCGGDWRANECRARGADVERERGLAEGDGAALARARENDRKAFEHFQKGEFSAAIPLLESNYATRCNLLGAGSFAAANTAEALAFFLGQAGQYENSRALLCRSVAIYRDRLGIGSPQAANALNSLGVVHTHLGQFEVAERLLRAAIDRRMAVFPVASPRVVTSWHNLANLLVDRGDFSSARDVYRMCLAQEQDTADPSRANTVNALAIAEAELGNMIEAESLAREALAVMRQTYGDEHPQTALLLNTLAAILNRKGDFEDAAACWRSADRVYSRMAVGNEESAIVLLNLAGALIAAGEFDTAREVSERALAGMRGVFREPHAKIASALCGLGASLGWCGRADESLTAYREGVQQYRATLGEEHAQTAWALTELAGALLLWARADCYDECERLLATALRIRERDGDSNTHLTRALLGDLRLRQGRVEEALALFQSSAEQVEGRSGLIVGDEIDRSRASAYLRQCDPFLGLVLAHLEAARRAGSEDRRQAELCAAFDAQERGGGAQLIALIGRGLDASSAQGQAHESLRKRRRALSEAAARVRALQTQLNARGASGQTGTAALEWELGEARRHELAAFRELRGAVAAVSSEPSLHAMGARELAATLDRNELFLTYGGTGKDTVLMVLTPDGRVSSHFLHWADGSSVSPGSLTNAIAGLLTEARVDPGPVARSIEREKESPARTMEELSAAMLPEAIRDQVAHMKRVFVAADGALAGFPIELLLLGATPSQSWIDMGPSVVVTPTATALAAKRQAATQRRRDGQESGHAMTLVGIGDVPRSPRAPQLPESIPTDGVLVTALSPDSPAMRIGLERGDVLLSYGGQPMQTSADLRRAIDAMQVPPASDPSSSSAHGDVTIEVWRAAAKREIRAPRGRLGVQLSPLTMPDAFTVFQMIGQRGRVAGADVASDPVLARAKRMPELPGTGIELNAIARQFREAGIADSSLAMLKRTAASSEAVRRAANRPRYLHFATHGLIADGERVGDSALLLAASDERTADIPGMLRLSDLLADWGGKLQGTELVVLSACQTARGRYDVGEGFVGLTWGFLYAGAESVIASLWKVDDAATLLLMNRLYENLLGNFDEPRMGFAPKTTMPKAEALHEAKRWLRSQTPAQNRATLVALGADVDALTVASRGGRTPSDDPKLLPHALDFAHPRYWAAFILIGSPD